MTAESLMRWSAVGRVEPGQAPVLKREKKVEAERILRKSISILGREVVGFKNLSPQGQEDIALLLWEKREKEMRYLTLGEPFDPPKTPQFVSGATTVREEAVQKLLLEVSMDRFNRKRKKVRYNQHHDQ